MKLATWNVNGIRNVHKKGLLTTFFDAIEPDIVGFQETKAEQHQSVTELGERTPDRERACALDEEKSTHASHTVTVAD